MSLAMLKSAIFTYNMYEILLDITHMNNALSLMNNSKLAATANMLHNMQKNIAPDL